MYLYIHSRGHEKNANLVPRNNCFISLQLPDYILSDAHSQLKFWKGFQICDFFHRSHCLTEISLLGGLYHSIAEEALKNVEMTTKNISNPCLKLSQ